MYQHLKTKTDFQEKKLLFICSGFNSNSNKFLILEQNLKVLLLKYNKVFNKASKKITKESVYKNIILLIRTITFLLYFTVKKNKKRTLIDTIKSVFFNMLAVKLNNKIYQIKQFENSYNLFYTAVFFIDFKLKLLKIIKSK